jgi:hypothetical protein
MLLTPGPGAAHARGQTPAPLTAPQPQPASPTAPARSVVYSIQDSAAIERYETDAPRVRAMVDRIVAAVTGKENAAAGWRSLVEPKDVVGIKISAAGGAPGATHRAVVAAIVDGLLAAGVPRENLLVWDRDADDLRAAGYLGRGTQSNFLCPVRAIEPKWGYDAKAIYTSPFLGKLIWGDLLFKGLPVQADEPPPAWAAPFAPPNSPLVKKQSAASPASAVSKDNLSNLSHYASILTKRVTKIVNVPVFSDSYFSGVGGALYNITIPNIDNWRRAVGPPQWGRSAIPEIYSEPFVGGRIVLNLTDGLIAQIAGAPTFAPLYARHHATLYASRDAVALDAVTLRQLELWRSQGQLPPIGDAGAHVRVAAQMGLGNFEPEKIDLRKLSP